MSKVHASPDSASSMTIGDDVVSGGVRSDPDSGRDSDGEASVMGCPHTKGITPGWYLNRGLRAKYQVQDKSPTRQR